MIATLAMVLLTTLPTAAASTGGTDTTFTVRPGARLGVNNFGGEIVVNAWNKNAVRIVAQHTDRVRVVVAENGPNLEVRAATRRGIPARVDYAISVPDWMPLQLQGVYTDIHVKGVKSEIAAETVKGEVNVEGGEGLLKLSSVEGPVFVGGSKGRLELNSIHETVQVIGAEGAIVVNAVNGDIDLQKIASESVEVSTVNGDVRFVGDLREHGSYNFSTHNGDLVLGMPEHANATVSVSTFSGDFQSVFPVQLEREAKPGRRFGFTMGSGAARINLESFEGTIQLKKAMELLEEGKVRVVPRKNLERIQALERLQREKLRQLQALERQLERRAPAPEAPEKEEKPEKPAKPDKP